MELVRNFTKLDKHDVALAGGKGASLGEMTQAGISVPPGFVVLAGAFERFIEETDLDVEIDSILHTVHHEEMHTVEAAAEKIQALILAEDMPKDIAGEIKRSFKILDAKFVAVRSSATAEDSSSAAWAGQLESYLNTTEKSLLLNVQKCWASLFTPRAIFYRFEKNLHTQKISVAVVVQKMVASEVSGIAFSVHPVTEDRNQLIIEAGLGLGEAIVSGQITPDSYVVEKNPRRIIDKNISVQGRALYRGKAGGVDWKDISKKEGTEPALKDAQILELSELIINIENHYRFPCDIEWAREKGKFYIVQSRPITTLAALAGESEGEPSKAEFQKSYSRDTTLFLQVLWARGLDEQAQKKFDWKNPHLPLVAHFVNDGVVEIWEHKKAINWFLDTLLAENKKGSAFLISLLAEYKSLLAELKKLHKKEYLASKNDRATYVELVYKAAFVMTVFFYTGVDERSPEKAKDISVLARKEGDFFADNDVFVRKNIAHIGKITQDLAGVVLPDEIHAIPAEALLKKRLKSYLLIDGREAYLGRLEVYASLNPNYHFIKTEPVEDVKEISGQAAFKGNARGIVRIVKKQSDMNRVMLGDILVSPMTTPDFLPAMQKAAAFVTDEGGITCHAAIVAREMKKPCIIGTKIATQVLKDGDLVEVDADKGIVRVLNASEQTMEQSETYSLLYRQSDVPVMLTDIILMPEGYGTFDGFLIQESDTLAHYLSLSGSLLMFRLGQSLLNAKVARRVIRESEDFIKRVKRSKISKGNILASSNAVLLREFKKITAMFRALCIWYRYSDWPALKALEDALVKEGCSQDTLIEVLEDPRKTKQYGLSARAHTIACLMKKLGDVRYAMHESAGVRLEPLFNIIELAGKRIGATRKEALMLQMTEIEHILKGGDFAISILRARLKGCVFLPPTKKNGAWICETGDAYLRTKRLVERSSNDGEIKGTIACKGKARGRVVIQMGWASASHIPPGSVFVCGMTSPNMVPFLKNAVAIVTDEGGLTSHAAIISRELKIPCIVGTAHATQVLKNGDRVEVDADNGIVRVLHKDNA